MDNTRCFLPDGTHLIMRSRVDIRIALGIYKLYIISKHITLSKQLHNICSRSEYPFNTIRIHSTIYILLN